MELCVKLIRGLMVDNFLKLNKNKTEVLFFGSTHLLSKLQASSLKIGSDHIAPSDVVRNIGAYMDKTLKTW